MALTIEERVAALERELAAIKNDRSKGNWWDKIAGSFANDPMFEEAMRLGRKWRESQRPKRRPRRGGSVKHGHS